MADGFQVPEFCLPSEILTDEDFVVEEKKSNKKTELVPEFCFPTEFPYDFHSYAVSSPGTESDDDENSLASLTRQLTRSSFYSTHPLENGWMISGSPQSTLTRFGSWSSRSTCGSNYGTPNGPSKVPSPPMTPFGVSKNKPWDHRIYSPAVKVPTHKINGGGAPGPPRSLSQLQYPAQNLNSPFRPVRVEYISSKHSTGAGMWYNQPQPGQNRGNPTHPAQKFSGSGSGPVGFGGYGGGNRADGGGGGVKRGCGGTGVFLPRINNNDKYAFPSDSRKKQVTALHPGRVVHHALNKNIVDINLSARSHARPSFVSDYGVHYLLCTPNDVAYQLMCHITLDNLVARRNAFLVTRQLALSSSTRGAYPPLDWTF